MAECLGRTCIGRFLREGEIRLHELLNRIPVDMERDVLLFCGTSYNTNYYGEE
jgi:hypothetical protein